MTDEVGVIAGPESEPKVEAHQEPQAEPKQEPEAKLETQEAVKEPKRNGFTRKIEKLQNEIAQLKATQQPKVETPTETAPKPEQFENWDEYYRAQARWEAKEVIRKELEAERSKSKEQQLRDEQKRLVSDFQNRAKEFSKTAPDFHEVVSDLEVSDSLKQAIMESDNGPQLIYALAKDQDELDELNGLSYGQIARRLGRMEAKLESPKADVKTTKAPPPIKPVGNSAKGTYDPYNSKGDDYEAYLRWRAENA